MSVRSMLVWSLLVVMVATAAVGCSPPNASKKRSSNTTGTK
ncbi:MAG TPA: hypothetical protein VL096_12930 [Pirellulaceae bacterium]|nr:hypothetical protein [Pirellulaceae bacterium]